MNFYSFLLDKISCFKDKVALTNQKDIYITYEELVLIINGISCQLNSTLKKNSRVLLLISNPYLETIYLLATVASGNIATPCTVHYGNEYCKNIINEAEPDLIIADFPNIGLLETKEKVLSVSFEALPKKKDPELYEASTSMLFLFTSGTTGTPKGVMLSHEGMIKNVQSIFDYFELTKNKRLLISRPLFHVAVLTGELLVGLYSGIQITFSDDFSPLSIVKTLSDQKIDVMCGTPTLFNYLGMLIRRSKKEIWLKKAAISGEKMVPAIVDRLKTFFSDVDFFHVYGMTEASPRITYLSPKLFYIKPTSIGQPLKNIEAKIIDEENNIVKRPEQIGELVVKTPSVMQGYWKNPEATQEKIIDGWLMTGDLAYFDSEGYYYIVGRKDNMIIKAGVNIYPETIENKLLESEFIEDVIAYGAQNVNLGQEIHIDMIINDDKFDIYGYCKAVLPQHHWPQKINIVKEIRKGPSGKKIRRR